MSRSQAEIEPGAWLTLLVTSLAVFMISVELTIIALALPEIRAAFHETSAATLSWVVTAYNIGVASLLLVSGWLADRYGWRKFFITGTAVFAVASLAAGMAPDAPALIAARVGQSIGGALQYPAGLALLLSAFPQQRRQMALGIYAGVGGLAAAVGPSLGAVLVDGFGWRAVFLVNVPVATFAVIAGRRWLTESVSGDSRDRVDLIGVPLASIGVGAIILAIVKGGDWGWGSSETIITFAVSGILIAVFFLRSRVHPAPLFDLSLFRLRTYALGNLGTVFFALAFFSWLIVLPSVLQIMWGWSVLRTGFAIAPSPVVAFLLSPPAGRLADRIGNGPILAVGGLFGVIGSVLQLTLLSTKPGYVSGVLIPGLFIGVAAGLGFAQLVGASMQDVRPRRYGMAGAGRTTVFQLATAIAIAIGFTLLGESSDPDEVLSAFRRVSTLGAFGFGAQVLLFALVYPRSTTTS